GDPRAGDLLHRRTPAHRGRQLAVVPRARRDRAVRQQAPPLPVHPSVRTSPGSPVTATDRALSMVHAAARAASEKLAEDILAFDVSDQLFITDAFLLCSAPNDRQVQIGRASCRERGSGWAAPGSGR